MKLKTIHKENNKETYVILMSDNLPGVSWFCIFDAKQFYLRYYSSGAPGGAKRVHEDIVDTYMNIYNVPYTKEELMENTYLRIDSNFMNYIEL